MPRNVRNFWLELDVDGRRTRIATGPVSRDGGFSLRVKVRDGGAVADALRVDGIARRDGSLELSVAPELPTLPMVTERTRHGAQCTRECIPAFAIVTRR